MKISFFELNIGTLLMRFYLTMLVVILPFFLGVPYLAILAVPILISCMLGVRVQLKKDMETGLVKAQTTTQSIQRKRA